jgi:hypothetical protein
MATLSLYFSDSFIPYFYCSEWREIVGQVFVELASPGMATYSPQRRKERGEKRSKAPESTEDLRISQ